MPNRLRHNLARGFLACGAFALVGATGSAAAQQPPPPSGGSFAGGAMFTPPPPPPEKGTLQSGRLIAPLSAPPRVQRVIAAANQIVETPYRYGGGHRLYRGRNRTTPDRAFDCSGAISWALYGGRFVRRPLDSGSFMGWGRKGVGRWITVYAHGGHAYVVVAGYRFDTSLRDPDAPGPSTGPRWSRKLRRSAAFVPRHPRRY